MQLWEIYQLPRLISRSAVCNVIGGVTKTTRLPANGKVWPGIDSDQTRMASRQCISIKLHTSHGREPDLYPDCKRSVIYRQSFGRDSYCIAKRGGCSIFKQSHEYTDSVVGAFEACVKDDMLAEASHSTFEEKSLEANDRSGQFRSHSWTPLENPDAPWV